MINFWASWCVPCKAEAPRLVASARRHSGKVAFLAIDVQDFKSDARRFLRRFHTDYVSLRDGSGTTYGDYGLTGVPETYYLSPSGRIVGHSAGGVSSQELEAGIALAVSREHSSTLAAQGPAPGPYEGSEPPPGIQAPDFTLRSYRGPLVRVRALRGKVVVVTFLDTKCTQQCPIIAGLIGRAIPLLSAAERRRVEATRAALPPEA